MSEETTVDTGLEPQTTIETAAIDENTTPEVIEQVTENQNEQQDQPPAEEKKFTQAELDQIVAKRLAREARARHREQEQRATTVSVPEGDLNINDFETTDDYIKALASKQAAEIVRQQRAAEVRTVAEERFEENVAKASEKYSDFEELVFNPRLPVSDTMRDAIFMLEDGTDVLYHLGSNPAEAKRITQLPPVQQALEIGRLHAKLAASPPVKKVSNASAPIAPLRAKGGAQSYDTTDPRSIDQMSTSEWIAAERQRQLRAAKAKQI